MKWKSIRARLFFTFMALAGAPLVLVGATLAWRSVVVQKSQALALERQTVAAVADRILSRASSLESRLLLAGRIENLIAASPQKRQEVLDALLRSKDPAFAGLVLLDAKGEELARAPSRDSDGSAESWLERDACAAPLVSGKTYFSPARYDAALHAPVMTVSVPLNDPTGGSVTGVLVAESSLAGAAGRLDALGRDSGETVFVTDGDGYVVLHPNPAAPMIRPRFIPPREDGFATGLSGKPVILASQRVEFGGRVLTVTAQRGLSGALSLAKETILVIIVLLLAALVFGAGLAYLLVRHVVRPIRELALTARAVRNGDYSRRAEVVMDDEIGELAQAFNGMTERLTETMRGLEDKVAELTATQEKLRESEEKYRLLAENSADVIWTVNAQLRMVYCSPSMERLTGYSPAEVRDRSIGFLLSPGAWKLIQAAHARRMREEKTGRLAGRPRILEIETLRKDGGEVWIECLITPLVDDQGALTGYMGVSRDITKRRRAEEALRKSEERFRAIADYTYDWESWFGADGRLMWVNPAVTRVTGYSVEECLNMPDYPLPMVHPADREMTASYLRFAAEGGTGNDREFGVVRKNGGVRQVAMSWQPIFDASGASLGVRASIRDVTESKRAEKALRESETKYRMLHEQASEGIMLMDAGERILDANPRALELLGYPACELRNLRYHELLSPDDVEAAPVRMQSVLAGETVRIERMLRKKDGGYLPVDVSARLIGDDLVQLMFRDMAERKRIEEELRASRDMAEEANRAKGEFVARVSHELRNPLSGIIGMTELVLKTAREGDQREYLGMIRDAALSLLTIINDLLDFSKMEAGKLDLRPVGFDLHETLSRIMKSFAVRADAKGVSLNLRIAASVPALVMGDPIRLTQVVRNFLDNAVKFTDQGSVSLDVKRVERPGEEIKLLFHVRDTGTGIAGEDLPRLFQSFSQVGHSYQKHSQGTGLGLSICKQLVEMMGGAVWVESKTGKGTTFYFTAVFAPAPQVQAADSALAAGEAEEAGGPDTGAGTARPSGAADPANQAGPAVRDGLRRKPRTLKVLLAEDNLVNRTFLSHFIADAGHDVITAVNGLDVLEKLEKERFDVVVMDVQMPEMDGVEASRRIRASSPDILDPNTPIIALTAYAMKEDRERFLQAGMNACVSKPVDMETLFLEIRKAAGETAPAGRTGPESATRAESAAEPGEEPENILDEAALARRFKGREALLATLVGDFLASVEESLTRIGRAMARENLEETAALAHSLVNAAIPIGSRLMAARGRDLEHAARNYGVKGAQAALDRLLPVARAVLERLRRLKID